MNKSHLKYSLLGNIPPNSACGLTLLLSFHTIAHRLPPTHLPHRLHLHSSEKNSLVKLKRVIMEVT